MEYMGIISDVPFLPSTEQADLFKVLEAPKKGLEQLTRTIRLD